MRSELLARQIAAQRAQAEPLLIPHLLHLRQRNLRPRTIEQRRDAVLRCTNRLSHPLAYVSEKELKTLQAELHARLAPVSVKVELVHIGQYLNWLHTEGHILSDPSRVLVKPKLYANLPRPMRDPDVKHAMDRARQPIRAWIALAAFCGLRCMEIAGLCREHIVKQGGAHQLRILGKGGKERFVPCPQIVIDEIQAADTALAGPLWRRHDGTYGAIRPVRVSQMVNSHLHSVGIPDTAHSLRHRFGTKLYAETRDPFLVAEVMGHASTQTTKLYVQMSTAQARLPVDAISTLEL